MARRTGRPPGALRGGLAPAHSGGVQFPVVVGSRFLLPCRRSAREPPSSWGTPAPSSKPAAWVGSAHVPGHISLTPLFKSSSSTQYPATPQRSLPCESMTGSQNRRTASQFVPERRRRQCQVRPVQGPSTSQQAPKRNPKLKVISAPVSGLIC